MQVTNRQEQLMSTARMLEAAGLRVTRESVTRELRAAASSESPSNFTGVPDAPNLVAAIQHQRLAEAEAEERNASRITPRINGRDIGEVPPSPGLVAAFRR